MKRMMTIYENHGFLRMSSFRILGILVFFVVSSVLMSECRFPNNKAEVPESVSLRDSLPKDLPDSVRYVTIEVENLVFPSRLLETSPYDSVMDRIYREFIRNEELVSHYKCKTPLVYMPHPFFDGMHTAYADHRPFVLSPDAIWILICQGFTRHVDAHAEQLRKRFVDFQGKKELKIFTNNKGFRNCPWEKFVPEFTRQIGQYVGEDLTEVLTCDFSTSSDVTRLASQMTIMASMKHYFSYGVYEICGIPTIILEGTPQDWRKVLDKARALRKYDLAWWIDEIEPILQKIVKASEGEVDKQFWKGMFKQHDLEHAMCGDPKVMADGWIVKFYPYIMKDGKMVQSNLQHIIDYGDKVPMEIVCAPVSYTDIAGTKTELLLRAGFVGLSQDSATMAIRPEIGWLVTKSLGE